ncbi:hypothetical protein Ndes2526B_g06704 [Nannochloris sp. 'desiccata']
MDVSLAISKGYKPPRAIKVAGKFIPFFVVVPVDPTSTANPSSCSYAPAAAEPGTAGHRADYKHQASVAIEIIRAQELTGERHDRTPAVAMPIMKPINNQVRTIFLRTASSTAICRWLRDYLWLNYDTLSLALNCYNLFN